MTTPAWISLGSNLGDRHAILDEALARLGQTAEVAVAAVSSYHETLPVGGPAGQGRFLNAAARLETTLSPHELLAAMQAIEADLGRVRTVRWGERTLDLDLLIVEGFLEDEPELRLPHPRLAVRRFVLAPLAEIAPDAIDTRTGMKVADLLANLNRRPLYLLVDESIQIKVPQLLKRLTTLLPAVPIASRREMLDRPREPAEVPDWIRSISQANDEAVQEAAAQCLPGGSKHWLVKGTCMGRRKLKDFPSGQIRPEDPLLSPYTEARSDLIIEPRAETARPTLLVATPVPLWRTPAARPSQVPIYWPEATEPDGIVAEVAAVCRGIAGV